MFVDASALTAILADEPELSYLVARLEKAETRETSPLAVWETAVAVSRILSIPVPDARRAVSNYLENAGITVVAIPPGAADIALDAFHRFGKGRHPAGLNMGDCFSYATARQLGLPLLYKGDDFTLTDIERA